jgi:Zn-dependent oligopeptidase
VRDPYSGNHRRQKISVLQNELRKYFSLHTVRRGGTFRYNNADHSIQIGLKLARKLLGNDCRPTKVSQAASRSAMRSQETHPQPVFHMKPQT